MSTSRGALVLTLLVVGIAPACDAFQFQSCRSSQHQRPADTTTDSPGSPAELTTTASADVGSARNKDAAESDLPRGTQRQRNHLHRAKMAAMQGQSETALKQFGDVLEEGPWTHAQLEAVTTLSQMLIDRDRAERTLKLLDDQVPEDEAERPSLRLLRARALSESDNPDGAIRVYDELIDEHPERLVFYPRLITLFEEADQPDRADDVRTAYRSRLETMANRLDARKTPETDKLDILSRFSQVSAKIAADAAEEALTDDSRDVRAAAARTLAQMGASGSIPELRALKKRASNQQVVRAAGNAIRRLE